MYDIMENAKTDLISIIVPVYNTEKYLCRCLDSIVVQTYSNLEIILVNDGSTDKSGKICEQYAQRDERIKVIHQENKGQAAARNAGVNAATGKYISFVDSDDYIAINMFESLLEAIKLHQGKVAGCQSTSNSMELGKCEEEYSAIVDKKYSFEYFASKVSWAVMGYLFQACIWNDIRFSEGRVYEDALIFPQLIERISCWFFIPDKLYFYNSTNMDSTTRSELSLKRLEDALYYIQYWNEYALSKGDYRKKIAFYICSHILGFINSGIRSTRITKEQVLDCINTIRGVYNSNYSLARETQNYKALKLKAKIRWNMFEKSPYYSQKWMNVVADIQKLGWGKNND